MVRLGLDPTQPMAVQQWGMLLAVNYPARAMGVSRHTSATAAKELCPEITLVHVEVIGNNTKETGKVSLKRYREASERIFDIIVSVAGAKRVERASVDEAFIDLTELAKQEKWQGDPIGDCLGENPPPSLSAGSRIASHIRALVYEQLRYTCSAGVSFNKLIAKRVCSFNKPAGQTVCSPGTSLQDTLARVGFQSLRSLGGKLGERIKLLLPPRISQRDFISPTTVLETVSLDMLCNEFGADTGKWVHMYFQGMCNEPVRDRVRVQSIVSAKQFGSKLSTKQLLTWLNLFVEEIVERTEADLAKFERIPSSLTLSLSSSRSHRMPFPFNNTNVSYESIHEAALILFHKLNALPDETDANSRLSLTASNFKEVVCEGQRITAYFQQENSVSELHTQLKPRPEEPPFQNATVKGVCKVCGASVEDLEEHMDWHLAVDMQEIEQSKANARQKPIQRKRKSDSPSIMQLFKGAKLKTS